MKLTRRPIFRAAAIAFVVIVLTAMIFSRDAIGQNVPDQTVQARAKEVQEPNAQSVAPDESGQLFSINIEDADIKDVLEALAYQAGLSLVLTEGVDGKVSLYLKDSTWQTAFNAILQAGGYTTLKKDNVLIVLKSEETPAIPEIQLITKTFNLNFANAKDLENTVKRLLSKHGRIGTDQRLNSLIVSDTATNLERISQVLEKLDVKAPQVMIEVLIVNVKLTDELKLGIDWTHLGTSNNFLTAGLSATTGSNPFGELDFRATTGNWSIEGLVDFVETHDNVQVLANPKVLVLNNRTASFKAVEEIPYRELSQTSEGGSIGTTSFKDVGVTLRVTPQITEDGYIIMHIMPEQSAQTGTFTVDGSETPVVESRNVDTDLRVKDGQTIIISGLRKEQQTVREDKIPILGDIPLLGVLFRKIITEKVESELGVFITPHIYTDGQLSADELKLLHTSNSDKSLFEETDPLRISQDD